MKKILVLSLFALTIIAIGSCGKDSIGTKPMISFLNYAYSPIISSIGVDVHFEIKDGDGDIENKFNFAPIYDTNPLDTVFEPRQMPDVEAHNGTNLTAEVILHLQSIDLPQLTPATTDSVHFLVFVTDNAGNISDTIATPKVEVRYE